MSLYGVLNQVNGKILDLVFVRSKVKSNSKLYSSKLCNFYWSFARDGNFTILSKETLHLCTRMQMELNKFQIDQLEFDRNVETDAEH